MGLLDLRQLDAIMEMRGITPEQLAILVGVSKATFYRYLNGKSDPGVTVARGIVRELHITWDAIVPEKMPGEPVHWVPFTWKEPDEQQRYFFAMARGRSVLTIHHRPDMYIATDDMHPFGLEDLHATWTPDRLREWFKWAESERQERLRFRRLHDFRHHVFAHAGFYRKIAASAKNLEMFRESTDTLERFDDRTTLTVVEDDDWNSLEATVNQWLSLESWDKITIIDDTLAMIRPDFLTSFVTYHRPTVISLRARIESILVRLDPLYRRQMPIANLIESRVVAISHLKQILVRGY